MLVYEISEIWINTERRRFLVVQPFTFKYWTSLKKFIDYSLKRKVFDEAKDKMPFLIYVARPITLNADFSEHKKEKFYWNGRWTSTLPSELRDISKFKKVKNFLQVWNVNHAKRVRQEMKRLRQMKSRQ